MAAAVLSLALGVGAASVVFETARQLLLTAPAVPAGDRVQVLKLSEPSSGQRLSAWSYPAYRSVRDSLAPDHAAIAYTASPLHLQLRADAGTERIAAELVSPGYFEALGLRLALGRSFDATHDEEGAATAQVAILAQALWRDRFGADPSVIGRTVMLDGHAFTVIGVVDGDTRGLSEQAQMWLPIAAAPRLTFANRLRGALSFWHGVFVVASAQDAAGLQARVTGAAASLHRAVDFRPLFRTAPVAIEVQSWLATRIDPAFAAVFGLVAGCVALLLALVASNLALLMLARVESRRAELAMRVALGASRLRMLGTLGHELFWVGVAGIAAGLLVAGALLQGLQQFGTLLRVGGVGVDGMRLGAPTFAFCAALCVAVLGLVAIGPGREALRLSAQGANAARSERPGAAARRRWFAGAQVLLATLLAVAAGLGLSTAWQALQAPLGFEPARVMTARVSLPAALMPSDGVTGFLGRVQDRLRAAPGVSSAAVANCLPVRDGCDRIMLTLEHGDDSARPLALNMVGGAYFETLSVPLLSGRVLGAGDDVGAEPVVVLNASAAQRYFPGADPLGRRVAISAGWPENGGFARVVGVVGDTLGGSLERGAEPMVYVPIAQFGYNDNFLLVRAANGFDPSALRAALEAAVRGSGADVVAHDVASMDERFGALTARRRLTGALLAGLAGVSLLLTAAGVYAVFALLVQRRRREFGIRLALGAHPRALQRGVAGEGLRIASFSAVTGAALGGLLAWRLAPALPEFQLGPPLPYLAALALTVGAAALACWLPAREAARTQPMATLNQD